MQRQQTNDTFSGDIVSSWMSMATNFWDNAAKVQSQDFTTPGNRENGGSQETKGNHGDKTFEDGANTAYCNKQRNR